MSLPQQPSQDVIQKSEQEIVPQWDTISYLAGVMSQNTVGYATSHRCYRVFGDIHKDDSNHNPGPADAFKLIQPVVSLVPGRKVWGCVKYSRRIGVVSTRGPEVGRCLHER